MEHLPIWIALRGRSVLVVGGGPAAASKAQLAARAGAHVTVVAPSVGPAVADLLAAPGFTHHPRRFDPADVVGSAVVFSASGDIETDRAVAEAARVHGVPVNAVDQPGLSTFLMPAIIDRDPVVVGISTGGAAPALAVRIRGAIEAVLPTRIGALARFAESFRTAVKGRVPAGTARLRFWNRVLAGAIGEAVLAGNDAVARERMLHLLNGPEADVPATGIVYLVGAGPGDPELLTLRALRLIQEADVLAYDRLVGPAVLEYGRRDAERIDVGKAANAPATAQDDICDLLVERARSGLRVVRLKGGDPFVFGRGGEEAEALHRAGVPVEVVPGVTAALGCAAAAGVPLTHREHASAVTFVTGHVRAGGEEPDWRALAAARHTLVVYMGLGAAGYIAGRLAAHGLAAGGGDRERDASGAARAFGRPRRARRAGRGRRRPQPSLADHR